MSDDQNLNREERAADALITGALHNWLPKEVSEAEVLEFLSSNVELTESEKAALERIHEQFNSRDCSEQEANELVADFSMESPYMAMNRENIKDQIPAEAREEIEKKRADLLAKLKARKHKAG